MTTRKYTSRSQQTTLTGSVTSGALTLPVVSATTLLGGATVSTGQTMTIVIDPDTSLEEVVDIYSPTTNPVAGNNLTVVRGQDGSSAQDHSAGAVVRHMIIGRDLREANTHQETSTGVHGLASTSSVVGTIDTQSLSNKTIDMTGATLTGLSSSGMSASSAAPKSYVDSILGSATAASTSASSAATSATSAAASATAAATSATSAAASATVASNSSAAATTSATSAATSATSAAASATTASNSASTATTQASNAVTSASSAATSATSAAASATAATTSANSASTSASSAATSATAAATSASSASTSASSALTSQTAAATSAASAATSQTAAATSASSAATSASSAATSASSALTSQTAAATSATSSATSATSSASSFTSMDQKYLGAKSADPTLNNQGGALATGATYFNTATNTMRVYNGSTWSNMTSTANITMFKYTASGGETSKSGADDNSATLGYTVGIEQVYLNGALLVRGADYVATTGTSITGLAALAAGDILTVLAFTPFSVATAVPLTTFTAKGDLAVGSGSSTVGTLGVGSDGSTLVANSANASGLGWSPLQAAGKNAVINGGMDIWQRGTSFALSTGTYTADRWQGYRSVAGSTVSRQATNDTTNLAFIQYCARVQRDSGNTSTAAINLAQSFESVNSIPLAGRTVVLSFYARAGANYSSASNALRVQLYAGTGTDQNVLTAGYTGSTLGIDQTATLTTTWQRFSYTVTIGATYTELGVIFVNTPVGTAGAADYFEVTGVQLELGSVATTFSRAGGTLQGELAACQRYYFQKAAGGTNNSVAGGAYYSTTSMNAVIAFPVSMRVSPTISQITGTNYFGFVANGGIDGFNSLTIDATGLTQVTCYNNTEMAGTAGFGGSIIIQNASGSLAFSAEL